MLSQYFYSLDYTARKRYLEKLKVDGETLPDPYGITEDLWLDEVTKWPSVEFGDLYTYLIDTKGPFTKEKLKAYKSLEAYSYFHDGYVRTVYYYGSSSSRFVILRAEVNPSQKTADPNHDAWVIVHKKTASIKAAHCKCMAG